LARRKKEEEKEKGREKRGGAGNFLSNDNLSFANNFLNEY
jgi:hypothetical protein